MALMLTGFWSFLHQCEEKRAYGIQITTVFYSQRAFSLNPVTLHDKGIHHRFIIAMERIGDDKL